MSASGGGTVHFTNHAVDRYNVRVRKGRSTDPRTEVESLRDFGVITDRRPWWNRGRSAAAYLTLGKTIAFVLVDKGNAYVATTCLTRGEG